MIEEFYLRALLIVGAYLATIPLVERDLEWQMSNFSITQSQRWILVIGYSIGGMMITSALIYPYALFLVIPFILRYSVVGNLLFRKRDGE